MPGSLKMPKVVLRYRDRVCHEWGPNNSQPHLKISKIIPVMAFVHCATFICTLNIFNGRHCLLRMVVEICFHSIHIMWMYPSVTVSWFYFEKSLSPTHLSSSSWPSLPFRVYRSFSWSPGGVAQSHFFFRYNGHATLY